jgi:hypothetical protein
LKQCAVIALATSPPSSWCTGDKTPFKPLSNVGSVITAGDPGRICEAFAVLDPTTTGPSTTPDAWRNRQGFPKFYAEIKLASSSDQRGLLPKLVALYYPADVNPEFKQGVKPRSLQLTVSGATPDGTKALSSIVVRLDDVSPLAGVMRLQGAMAFTNKDPPDWLLPGDAPRPWASALALPEKYSPPANAAEIFPVNLSTEIREIHDPNPFLQAFAKIFSKQKDALKKEAEAQITAAVNPPSTEEKQAAYDTLANAVYTAEATVRNACQPPNNGRVNESTVRGALLSLIGAHGKLSEADTPAIPITFSPTADDLQKLRGSSAADICKAFGVILQP